MSALSLLLNLLVIALLGVTIGYCWLLNKRIRILQDSKSELAQLLSHFDESTQRASESIIALQTASKKIGENIQFRIDKANYLIDDLSYMIEKGNKLADQMEASFAVGRARARAIAEQPTPAAPAAQEVAHEEVPVMVEPMFAAAASAARPTHRERTSASLEAVLERVVGRGKPAIPANDTEQKEPPARSKAEQELLAMIKAGIKG